MTDIIFAIPRYEYASYRDLYTLIALSGFPTCYIDEIDPQSDHAYILTIYNHEVPPQGYPGARASIYLYDFEYHLGADNQLPPLEHVTRFAGDAWYAQQIGAKYVPMGSHPGLRPQADSTSAQDYDVAYLGYIIGVPRREAIRQQLLQRGVKLSPPTAWGDERHRILSNSRVYLNVHQRDDAPTICPLRMVVAAAYGLPVVSETVNDAGLFGGTVLQLAYQFIGDTIPHVPQDDLRGRGEFLHMLLCDYMPFRKSIEAAL
jgi:hypothetical protein